MTRMVASAVSELPLVGGHLALDLVNTVEPRLPVAGRHEHLMEPRDLLTWAQHAAMINDAEARSVIDAWETVPSSASTALASTKQIREALASVLYAIIDPATQTAETDVALDGLWLRWSLATARSSLVLERHPDRGVRLNVGSTAASLITDRAAHAAVELLREADLTRLGFCPPDQHGCGWLFLDHSRNGSRRWCTMEGCGAYAKARRLTARRRATRVTANKADIGSD